MATAGLLGTTLDSLWSKRIMIEDLVYLYLLSPLHTGGTTQEGNLLGIARESHYRIAFTIPF